MKRVFSMLLCAALVLTMLPTTVFAEGVPEAQDSGAPPTLSIGVSGVTETGASLSFIADRDGAVYYLVQEAGKVAPEEAALLAGKPLAVTANTKAIVPVEGLATVTDYTAYALLEDGERVRSVVVSAGFSTLDAPTPDPSPDPAPVPLGAGAPSMLTAATAADVSYIDADGNLTDTGTDAISGNETVTVIDAADAATIPLPLSAGWYLVRNSSAGPTITIYIIGEVHLILADGCHLKASGISGNPGISVTGVENSLTLYAQSDDEDKMGALTATGGVAGAGIGGGISAASGAVTVNGGNVTATGGSAGIGGGGGNGGPVTINGGIIIASSGIDGAGIGGGIGGNGGTVIITGGRVSATGKDGGAGIGGGIGGNGDTVIITGGRVSATGKNGGAGIGGGRGGNGDTVTITGGTVTAIGLDNLGAGIGCGQQDSINIPVTEPGTVYISGGSVLAQGYKSMGTGKNADTAVTLTPKNSADSGGVPVHLTTVTLDGLTVETAVTALTADLSGYSYRTRDMRTDGDGKLYLYLPDGTQTTGATASQTRYIGLAVTSDTPASGGVLYPASGDAGLAGLTISVGTLTPAFGSGTYAYTASVGHSVSTVTVTPATRHPSAAVTVKGTSVPSGSPSGSISLDVGPNTIPIVITAQDGITTQTYTITITRAAAPAPTPGDDNDYVSTSIITEKQPNMPTTARQSVPGTVSDGVLSAHITEQMVRDAIKAAQDAARRAGKTADGIALAFDITGNGSHTGLNVTLDAGAIDRLKEAGVRVVKIGSSILDITLDTAAIAELDKQSSGTVRISAIRQTKLSDAAKRLIGSRPVFDITVSYQQNGMTETVSDFGKGTVTLGIAHKAESREKSGNLYGVFVDKNGKPQLLPSSSYDNGRLIFSRNSLSTYGVGYKTPAPDFTDTAKHWAKDNIDFVVSRGLIADKTAPTFAPNTAITRADFLMALGKLSGTDVSIFKQSSFTDVKATDPAMPYIEWAVKNKIVQGIGGGKFGPALSITNQDMAVMMRNYANATGYKLPVSIAAATFSDNEKIAAYAKDAVKAIQQAGIMQGKGANTFDPQGNATRGEAATILRRFVELVIDEGTARGWVQNDAGKWQYIGENGRPITGWLTDTDIQYYFDENGIMVSDKWLQISGKWYYFRSDGSLAKSTKIGGYEVDENGVRKSK